MDIEKTKISIVIVNYKSWKHLDNCLKSLEKINSDTFILEVIIVDNTSNDGCFSEFEKKFKNFIFIQNTGNNGFANACNFGANHAKGEWLFFLNPDTMVPEGAIDKIVKTASENPDYGIVSCNQLNNNGSYENQIRFFPEIQTLFGLFRSIYKKVNRKKLATQFDENKNIVFPDWVSGSVVFMSKVWFDKVGGWNDAYWMYFEDVELSKSVQKSGGKIALLRDINIIHNHGGASRLNIRTSTLTKTEVLISKHVYVKNNMTGVTRFITQFLLVLINLLSKLALGVLGAVFFFIPKMRLQVMMLYSVLKYYLGALMTGTWLSIRSMKRS